MVIGCSHTAKVAWLPFDRRVFVCDRHRGPILLGAMSKVAHG